MAKFKIAAIVGSTRRESINRQLAEALARLGADKLAVTIVPIGDLPLYNQDLEAPLPETVKRFKSEIAAADGVLFVTPEHSRSIPAVLKNAIDWGSRPWDQNSWAGKTAAITGTSPGAIATAVAQQHLRQVMGDLGVLVMGGEISASSPASWTQTTTSPTRARALSCKTSSINSRAWWRRLLRRRWSCEGLPAEAAAHIAFAGYLVGKIGGTSSPIVAGGINPASAV